MTKILVALAVAGGALGIAGAVQASIPDSNGVAHGCYYAPGKISGTNPRPGDWRVIDTDKGQHCAADEQSLDLATPQYVQSTVNPTAYMLKGTFSIGGPGIYVGEIDCAAGYVGTDPWEQAPGTFPVANNWHLTLNASGNAGELNGTSPNNKTYTYFSVSAGATFPFDVSVGATCVDGRVFGQAGPASPAGSGGEAALQKVGSR